MTDYFSPDFFSPAGMRVVFYSLAFWLALIVGVVVGAGSC